MRSYQTSICCFLVTLVSVSFTFSTPQDGYCDSGNAGKKSGSQYYQYIKNPVNPANKYDPQNPLNPASRYSPVSPMNPANKYDSKNPLNPVNRYSPSNPLNPLNRYDPANPLSPSGKYNPYAPFRYNEAK